MDLLRRPHAVAWLVIAPAVISLSPAWDTLLRRVADRPPATTVITWSPQTPIAPGPRATISARDRVLLLYDEYLVGITDELVTYSIRYPADVHLTEVRGAAVSGRVLALAVPGAVVLVDGHHLRSTSMPGGHVLGVTARGSDGFTAYIDRGMHDGPLEVGAVDVGSDGAIVAQPPDGLADVRCCVPHDSDECRELGGLRPIQVPRGEVQIRWQGFQPYFEVTEGGRHLRQVAFEGGELVGNQGMSSAYGTRFHCESRWYCRLPSLSTLHVTTWPEMRVGWDRPWQISEFLSEELPRESDGAWMFRPCQGDPIAVAAPRYPGRPGVFFLGDRRLFLNIGSQVEAAVVHRHGARIDVAPRRARSSRLW